MVVVYLRGGSGKSSRDVAFLFGPKSQPVSKKSTSQEMKDWGGVLTAGKPNIPPEVGGQLYLYYIWKKHTNAWFSLAFVWFFGVRGDPCMAFVWLLLAFVGVHGDPVAAEQAKRATKARRHLRPQPPRPTFRDPGN